MIDLQTKNNIIPHNNSKKYFALVSDKENVFKPKGVNNIDKDYDILNNKNDL